MKKIYHPLWGAALLFLLCYTSVAYAQNRAIIKAPDTIELSAIGVDLDRIPTLFFKDARLNEQDGTLEYDYKPFNIGNNRISSKYQIPILEEKVQLFADQTPSGAQEQKMVPAITVPAEKDADLIMVIFRDKNGKTQTSYLNDDAEAHPAGTVRLANFTDFSIGASIGDKPKIIKPKQVSVLGRPTLDDNRSFPLGYVVDLPDGPYQPPKKLYRFGTAGSRLFLLYANRREFMQNEDGEMEAVGIFPVMFPILDSL